MGTLRGRSHQDVCPGTKVPAGKATFQRLSACGVAQVTRIYAPGRRAGAAGSPRRSPPPAQFYPQDPSPRAINAASRLLLCLRKRHRLENWNDTEDPHGPSSRTTRIRDVFFILKSRRRKPGRGSAAEKTGTTLFGGGHAYISHRERRVARRTAESRRCGTRQADTTLHLTSASVKTEHTYTAGNTHSLPRA